MKKKVIVGMLVSMLVIVATGTALADWEPEDGHKMHYPQLPHETGWDVDWGWWPLGDDWQCTEDGPVTDIHFWISWFEDQVLDIPWIDISIWSNNPQGPHGWSEPLDMLWQRTFLPHEFQIAGPWPGDQGWLFPWGESIPHNHQLYFQVNIPEIDDPFEQVEGEIYWLVIMMPFEQEWIVGWKNSLDFFMDHAVWWNYIEEAWWIIDGIDFAFVITGEEIPPPECCLEIENVTGGLLDTPPTLTVNAKIANTGDGVCTNITWEFTFAGGIIFLGPNSGTIASLTPGSKVTVSSNIIIGLGIPGILPCKVTVKADSPDNVCAPPSVTKDLFVFLFLLKVMP